MQSLLSGPAAVALSNVQEHQVVLSCPERTPEVGVKSAQLQLPYFLGDPNQVLLLLHTIFEVPILHIQVMSLNIREYLLNSSHVEAVWAEEHHWDLEGLEPFQVHI